MKNRAHLPAYGIGPVYLIVCITLTVGAVILGHLEFIKVEIISVLRIPSLIIGSLLNVCLHWCPVYLRQDFPHSCQ